jgi:hypothetical protein
MRGEGTSAVRGSWWKSGVALLLGTAMAYGCGSESLTPAGQREALGTTEQGLLSYGSHTYVISSVARTWADASRACAELDMGLVTLDDSAEEAWLLGQMPSTAGEWWLGYNDVGIEGFWTWVGGPSSYTRWNPGEPNGAYSTEDCATASRNAGWNDAQCSQTRVYACESIPVRVSYRDTHEYTFFTQMKPWAQARAVCQGLGADLVTIDDAGEDQWLKTQVPAGLASFIGFTDQAQEGNWTWADGTPAGYTNWRRLEPNNTSGLEHCAVNNAPVSGSNPGGGWNDIPCTSMSSFICERALSLEGYDSFAYQAAATANATLGTRNHDLWLQAGQTLEVGTCGMPLASATGDTFLRLEGPGGVEVAANDDDCKGSGSRIRFRVPDCGTGTYVVRAGCYDNSACQGRVSVRIIPAPAPQ